jgi:predicted metal-binding membrane protein
LALLVGLAWWYLFFTADRMSAMPDMDGMRDIVGMHAWTARDYVAMFVMWAVMMVGMMVPTAMRAIRIYTTVAQAASERGSLIASVYFFVLGYVLVWTAFSVFATLLQAGLDALGLLSPTMASSSALLGAGLLVVAGLYQLTPWKDVCLRHCQMPATYLAGRFGPRLVDAVGLGVRHGGYCLGCCWLLMLLLFVGGVMNLVWIAAITGFVLLEKLLPTRFFVSRGASVLMIAVGVAFLIVESLFWMSIE